MQVELPFLQGIVDQVILQYSPNTKYWSIDPAVSVHAQCASKALTFPLLLVSPPLAVRNMSFIGCKTRAIAIAAWSGPTHTACPLDVSPTAVSTGIYPELRGKRNLISVVGTDHHSYSAQVAAEKWLVLWLVCQLSQKTLSTMFITIHDMYMMGRGGGG